MNRSNQPVVYLFFLLLCSSCTHYYYAPNSANVPLLQQKGDFRGALHIGFGTNLQMSYAATNSVGLMANGMWADEDNGTEFNRGSIVELGAGYFKPLEDRRVIFETYAGFGGGEIGNRYQNQSESNVKFSRFFFQPSIGFKSKIVDVALSSRMALLSYGTMTVTGNPEPDDMKDINTVRDSKTSLLLEPAITFRLGFDVLKFFGQIVFSENLTNKDIPAIDNHLNIGVMIALPSRSNGLKD